MGGVLEKSRRGASPRAEEEISSIVEAEVFPLLLGRLFAATPLYDVTPSGGHTPKSLMEHCVHSICWELVNTGAQLEGLPRELVQMIMNCLLKHEAVGKSTLEAFQGSEVTSLALGTCKGVDDSWVPAMQGCCGPSLSTLDLSSCTGLSDAGINAITSLENLETANFRGCTNFGNGAIMALACSRELCNLNLGFCRGVTDAGIGSLSKFTKITALDVEGLESITDASAEAIGGLHSLTDLNLSQCHAVTVKGIAALRHLTQLRSLHIGWITGLGKRKESYSLIQNFPKLQRYVS
ncbi:unnamed protein product [Chrysoparadoxa australica]